jgi:hypothetical protein
VDIFDKILEIIEPNTIIKASNAVDVSQFSVDELIEEVSRLPDLKVDINLDKGIDNYLNAVVEELANNLSIPILRNLLRTVLYLGIVLGSKRKKGE